MNMRSFLIKNKDVTIISNNCFAGMFYKRYGIKFNSPTICLFIRSSDYITFLEYLPQIVKGDYFLKEKIETKVKWPVGLLHINQCNRDIEKFLCIILILKKQRQNGTGEYLEWGRN